uniref:Uncharacterized protein AlNc14C2G307 n=1 Tax=Albugo laibachii Nc14 TaxID=890382 RepID=F0VZG9_9STRA|nr:conserved hypothetical protein [Albugo laibachii Nc14]|eukprot:CCA14199.1 conserved hypothetical protein [Albugo laibachii Nc14]
MRLNIHNDCKYSVSNSLISQLAHCGQQERKPPSPDSNRMNQMRKDENDGLHRCAVALCSDPAVAHGVCSVQLENASPFGNGMHAHGATFRSQRGPLDQVCLMESQGIIHARQYAIGREHGASDAPERARNAHLTGSIDPIMAGSSLLGAMDHRSINASVGAYDRSNTMYSIEDARDGTRQLSLSHSMSSHHSDSDTSMDADKETNLRRERNRIAARKSRQRKLDRISSLEDEKRRLEQRRDMLLQEIRSLKSKDCPNSAGLSVHISDYENDRLQSRRLNIIQEVQRAYNGGDILSVIQHFRDDSIICGPQNSSAHLRGKDALVLDYLCSYRLFSDFKVSHTSVDCGGPQSQHIRVHWIFTGKIRDHAYTPNREFFQLIENVKGKSVTIEGVSNYSFSKDKISYIHRSVDQAKFLSELVGTAK